MYMYCILIPARIIIIIKSLEMKRSCHLHASECKVLRLSTSEFSCDFCGCEKDGISPDDAKLLESGNLTDADTLLARWWRRRSRDTPEGMKLSVATVSPSTRLRQICRCAKASINYTY